MARPRTEDAPADLCGLVAARLRRRLAPRRGAGREQPGHGRPRREPPRLPERIDVPGRCAGDALARPHLERHGSPRVPDPRRTRVRGVGRRAPGGMARGRGDAGRSLRADRVRAPRDRARFRSRSRAELRLRPALRRGLDRRGARQARSARPGRDLPDASQGHPARRLGEFPAAEHGTAAGLPPVHDAVRRDGHDRARSIPDPRDDGARVAGRSGARGRPALRGHDRAARSGVVSDVHDARRRASPRARGIRRVHADPRTAPPDRRARWHGVVPRCGRRVRRCRQRGRARPVHVRGRRRCLRAELPLHARRDGRRARGRRRPDRTGARLERFRELARRPVRRRRLPAPTPRSARRATPAGSAPDVPDPVAAQPDAGGRRRDARAPAHGVRGQDLRFQRGGSRARRTATRSAGRHATPRSLGGGSRSPLPLGPRLSSRCGSARARPASKETEVGCAGFPRVRPT